MISSNQNIIFSFAFSSQSRYAAFNALFVFGTMNFQEWLHAQGASKSTVKHYVGAVYSKLTTFSIEHGLSPLRDIQDPDELGEVIDAIKANPEFIKFNTTGNNMYSAALHIGRSHE